MSNVSRRQMLKVSSIAVATVATGTLPIFAAEKAKKEGWWIKIHTDKTEASSVKMWIGLGGQDKTHKEWMTWNSNDPSEIDLPEDIRQVKEIWFKAQAIPKDKDVYICIHYKDGAKQRMEFDDHEEHEVSQSDDDKC